MLQRHAARAPSSPQTRRSSPAAPAGHGSARRSQVEGLDVSAEVVISILEGYTAGKVVLDPLVDQGVLRARHIWQRALHKARGRYIPHDERSLMKVLQEGVLSDDAVLAEYLAGVIAGGNGTDDSVSTVAQIGRLSALQLRMHYVIYRQLWLSESARPSATDQRDPADTARNSTVFLRLEDLHAVLPIAANGDGERAMISALHVLAREALIADVGAARSGALRENPTTYEIREAWDLGLRWPREFPAAGLVCSPTPSGIELFLWGCGNEEHDPTYIRNMDGELVQAPVDPVRGSLVVDLPALASD